MKTIKIAPYQKDICFEIETNKVTLPEVIQHEINTYWNLLFL